MLLYGIKIFFNGAFIYMVLEDFKSIETTIKQHAIKRTAMPKAKTIQKGNSITLESSDIEVNLVVDSKIFSIIQKDYRVESFYYFYEDLMSRSSFGLQQFGRHFKQSWPTYEEYLEYWKEVHWKLKFYEQAYILSEDIIINSIVSLKDFQDPKTFKAVVDNLLKERLSDKELEAYKDFLYYENFHYECLILNYETCRYYKLEAQSNESRARKMINHYYKNCIQDALQFRFFNDWSFYQLKTLIEERSSK